MTTALPSPARYRCRRALLVREARSARGGDPQGRLAERLPELRAPDPDRVLVESRRRLSRASRLAQLRRVRAARPRRRASAPAVVLGRHRRDHRLGRHRGRAADRELAVGAGRRDARPPVPVGPLDRGRDRDSGRALPRGAAGDGARGRPQRAVASRRRSRSAVRLLRELGITRRVASATTADAAREVSEREDETEAAIASRAGGCAVRAAGARAGGRRPLRRVDQVRRGEAVHRAHPRRPALALCADVLHRPCAGRALPRARADRGART